MATRRLEPPRLEDGIVLVREAEERDAPAWSRAALDTDVQSRAYHDRVRFTEEGTRAYIRRMRSRRAAGEAIALTIADPEDTEFLGQTLLFGLDWDEGVAELGFWIASWARGRGCVDARGCPDDDVGVRDARARSHPGADACGQRRRSGRHGASRLHAGGNPPRARAPRRRQARPVSHGLLATDPRPGAWSAAGAVAMDP